MMHVGSFFSIRAILPPRPPLLDQIQLFFFKKEAVEGRHYARDGRPAHYAKLFFSRKLFANFSRFSRRLIAHMRATASRILLLLLVVLVVAEEKSEPTARKKPGARSKRSQSRESAEQLVDSAFALHQAGNLLEAVQQYRQAIRALRSDGGSPAKTAHFMSLCAHNLAYLSAHELNDLSEARIWYAEATRVRPDYFEAYHNLGSALQDHGLFSEALDQFKLEHSLRPDMATPLIAMAACSHRLGDVDSAGTQASRAAALDPSSTSAFNGAGWFLHLAGRSRMSEEILKRGIRLHPTNAAMYFHRGKALSDLADTKGAIKMLKAAVQLEPTNSEAHLLLGMAYFTVGDSSM
jgi:tetratricopeptide (TPR) repeat protein